MSQYLRDIRLSHRDIPGLVSLKIETDTDALGRELDEKHPGWKRSSDVYSSEEMKRFLSVVAYMADGFVWPSHAGSTIDEMPLIVRTIPDWDSRARRFHIELVGGISSIIGGGDVTWRDPVTYQVAAPPDRNLGWVAGHFWDFIVELLHREAEEDYKWGSSSFSPDGMKIEPITPRTYFECRLEWDPSLSGYAIQPDGSILPTKAVCK